MDEYVTIAGLIQFEPRQRTTKDGKQVRDVAVRAIGNNKLVNVTVWPEKDHIPLSKGDFIVTEGKFSSSMAQNKKGEQQTYYNLSANTLLRFAGENADGTTTTPAPAKAAASAAPSVDDFPF